MQLSWDQVCSTDETNHVCKELALLAVSHIADKQLAVSLSNKIESGDYLSLCKMDLPYSLISCNDAMHAAQALAFYQKRIDLDLGINREEVAYGKFMESERLCSETNSTFRWWSLGGFQFRRDVEQVFYHAQRKIASLLGDVPPLSEISGRFGPGATTQVKRRNASARRKLSVGFACSEELVGLLPEVLAELPQWVPFTEDSDSVTVPVTISAGILSFVPKSAKTDRSIVVEPSLNSFFQLGIGDYIARRLRTRGVDITDQSRNQQLARTGSIDGGLATLDLSSASDTIARELVAHLLPIDWFLFLSQFRTGTVEYKGTSMKLQKFSSMGNGFTFPLETLIFWALAKSAAELTSEGEVSVYGDDIIVPTGAVDLLVAVLDAAGFILNKDKSFWSGPFRESCGKDYYKGIPIRPVFLKHRIDGATLYSMHNFFVRICDTGSAAICRKYLKPREILEGPDGYGDGHLISDRPLNEYGARTPKINTLGYGGFIFDTYTWKSRKCFAPLPGDYVFPSYSAYVREGAPTGVPELVGPLARLGRKRFIEIYGEGCYHLLMSGLARFSTDETPYRKSSSDGDHFPFGVTLPGTDGYKRISIYTFG